MTHQRAIEAGARALCRLLFDHGDLEKVSSPKTRTLLEKEAEEVLTTLAAEGFVVVQLSELQYIAENSGERTIRDKAQSMITAAQQEQNDAGE